MMARLTQHWNLVNGAFLHRQAVINQLAKDGVFDRIHEKYEWRVFEIQREIENAARNLRGEWYEATPDLHDSRIDYVVDLHFAINVAIMRREG